MGQFLLTSKQLYGKPSADSSSYQYASHTDLMNIGPADFLNELNALGSAGYCRLIMSNLVIRRIEALALEACHPTHPPSQPGGLTLEATSQPHAQPNRNRS